jgi:hypothetical protein
MTSFLSRGLLVALVVSLPAIFFGCAAAPPAQPDRICEVFEERRSWFKAAQRSERRWGVPVAIQMAFVQRESSFMARARPPRKRLFGVVPWKRPSSAYGYAQATNSTWEAYQRATRRRFADRNDFADALDFIGWYNRTSHDQLKIPLDDAYRLYLAYHEGRGGYARGSYKRRPAVRAYAKTVAQRAQQYQAQLDGCRKKLRRKRFLFF